jgi:hypothetical protein
VSCDDGAVTSKDIKVSVSISNESDYDARNIVFGFRNGWDVNPSTVAELKAGGEYNSVLKFKGYDDCHAAIEYTLNDKQFNSKNDENAYCAGKGFDDDTYFSQWTLKDNSKISIIIKNDSYILTVTGGKEEKFSSMTVSVTVVNESDYDAAGIELLFAKGVKNTSELPIIAELNAGGEYKKSLTWEEVKVLTSPPENEKNEVARAEIKYTLNRNVFTVENEEDAGKTVNGKYYSHVGVRDGSELKIIIKNGGYKLEVKNGSVIELL